MKLSAEFKPGGARRRGIMGVVRGLAQIAGIATLVTAVYMVHEVAGIVAAGVALLAWSSIGD